MPEVPPPASSVSPARVDELFQKAGAERWTLARDEFRTLVTASVRQAFPGADPTPRELDRYLAGLHAADLALAGACALGRAVAWDHFVLTFRPILYRAADALSPGGGVREITDALYADLYGLRETDGVRRSLFRYFHGRSSLATWLRSVLAQRYVDWLRAQRRIEPLEDGDTLPAAASAQDDPDRRELLPLVGNALRTAIDRLPPKDRLRLRSYYLSQLTLAQIGGMMGEHEATVSRQLARTRRELRNEIERHLRQASHLSEAQVARALELAIEDPGGLNLQHMLSGAPERKDAPPERSTE